MSALQRALERVYAGDQSLEAAALSEQLESEGYAVVPFGFTYELPYLPPVRRRWWPWRRR